MLNHVNIFLAYHAGQEDVLKSSFMSEWGRYTLYFSHSKSDKILDQTRKI